MKRKILIQNTTAAFLLVLFAFGSTPKLFLHSLVANHKDTVSLTKATGTQVAKTPVYCHCDNLVVESPFLYNDSKIEIQKSVVYTQLFFSYRDSYTLPHHSYFELRGPPITFIS